MKTNLLIAIALLSVIFAIPAWGQAPSTPVQVLQSDASGVTLIVNFEPVQFDMDQVEGVACQRLSADSEARAIQSLLLGAPPEANATITLTPLQTQPLPKGAPLCQTLTERTTPDQAEPTTTRVVDLGYMRSQHIIRLEIPAVHTDPVTGKAQILTQARVQIRFTNGQPGETITEPASFEAMFRELLINYEQARHFRAQPQSITPEVGVWVPPAPAWRILVDEPGIYEITYQDLRDAGLPVDSLDPRTLKLFNFGKEVPITVTGEEDSRLDSTDVLLFFGQGVDTRYTDVNVYWLTYGRGNGLRMNEQRSSSYASPAGYYLATLHEEINLHYVPNLPMAETHDHWYGSRITVSGHDNKAYRDISFTVTDPYQGTNQATLSLVLAGNMNATHHLRVYVNGTIISDDTWIGRTLFERSIDFSSTLLRAGQNTVRLELINDAPNQNLDQVYIDWLELTYPRKLKANDNVLAFNNPASAPRSFQIDGFSTPSLELYDITDPTQVSVITGWQSVYTGNGNYQLRFTDTATTPRDYWAQATSQRRKPLDIQAKPIQVRPLASPQNGADYLVIYFPTFKNALQPLLTHRANQGYRVMAVSTQEVYDEFGYGMMSAEAIHDFLAYAFSNWQSPPPSYVLLVGDGTYDPRHYLASSADTYLPPYLAMVDPTLGETAADNRFVTLTGEDILPEMHIGRLPANSPAETTAMVNKILAYEQTPINAPWTKHILFVSDDLEGGGGNFYALSDAIADGFADPPANRDKLIPDDYRRTKLYLGRTCETASECRQKMTDAINQEGVMFVSYIGHGTKTFWAQEKIWDVTSASQMSNGTKFPIMLPMTCNEGYFHEAAQGAESTSEAAVRLPNNGAIASWAPTGYGLSAGHDYLERGFFLWVYHGLGQRIGPATTAGKLYLASNAPNGSYFDLIDTFLLMGDPALRLPLPEVPPQQTYLPIVLKE